MNRLNDSIFAPSSPFQPLDSYPCEPFLPYDASRIQHALSRKLGPEHISSRRGAGNMTLSYIEGWRAISIANEIFGFNGWRSNLFNMVVDFVDVDSQTGNVSIGLSCMVRITLRDGTYREDAGYGLIENCKSKAQAFEKVRKEAVTDALKRAMRQFGNVLGNCLYDKDFLRYVAREPKERRTDLSSGKLFRNSDLDGGLRRMNSCCETQVASSERAHSVTTQASPPAEKSAPVNHNQPAPVHSAQQTRPVSAAPTHAVSTRKESPTTNAGLSENSVPLPENGQQHTKTNQGAPGSQSSTNTLSAPASVEDNSDQIDLDDILSGVEDLADNSLFDMDESLTSHSTIHGHSVAPPAEASLAKTQSSAQEVSAQLYSGSYRAADDFEAVDDILSDIDWSDDAQLDLIADLESNRPVVPESPTFPCTEEPPKPNGTDSQQVPIGHQQEPRTKHEATAQPVPAMHTSERSLSPVGLGAATRNQHHGVSSPAPLSNALQSSKHIPVDSGPKRLPQTSIPGGSPTSSTSARSTRSASSLDSGRISSRGWR